MMFSAVVSEYWEQAMAGRVLVEEAGFRLTVNPDLTAARRVGVLTTDAGTQICLHPEVASAAELTEPPPHATAQLVLDRLRTVIELNGADYLHYLPLEAADALRDGAADDPGTAAAAKLGAEVGARRTAADPQVRPLTAADQALFTTFTSGCSAADLDEAYVELDHWLVVGLVVEGALVAAASAYPWDGSQLADVGVITHPSHRGRGYARDVVRAIARRVLELGYQPQYRCYHTNTASAAVALSAGFARFGSWDMPPE